MASQITHQPPGNAVDNVGVVESSSVVLEEGPDVEARLVVPEGQEVVDLVVGHGLGGRGRRLPHGGLCDHRLGACSEVAKG